MSKPGEYLAMIVRKSALWDELMDEREREDEDPRAEALRRTARGAAEDWQAVKLGIEK